MFLASIPGKNGEDEGLVVQEVKATPVISMVGAPSEKGVEISFHLSSGEEKIPAMKFRASEKVQSVMTKVTKAFAKTKEYTSVPWRPIKVDYFFLRCLIFGVFVFSKGLVFLAWVVSWVRIAQLQLCLGRLPHQEDSWHDDRRWPPESQQVELEWAEESAVAWEKNSQIDGVDVLRLGPRA